VESIISRFRRFFLYLLILHSPLLFLSCGYISKNKRIFLFSLSLYAALLNKKITQFQPIALQTIQLGISQWQAFDNAFKKHF